MTRSYEKTLKMSMSFDPAVQGSDRTVLMLSPEAYNDPGYLDHLRTMFPGVEIIENKPIERKDVK